MTVVDVDAPSTRQTSDCLGRTRLLTRLSPHRSSFNSSRRRRRGYHLASPRQHHAPHTPPPPSPPPYDPPRYDPHHRCSPPRDVGYITGRSPAFVIPTTFPASADERQGAAQTVASENSTACCWCTRGRRTPHLDFWQTRKSRPVSYVNPFLTCHIPTLCRVQARVPSRHVLSRNMICISSQRATCCGGRL